MLERKGRWTTPPLTRTCTGALLARGLRCAVLPVRVQTRVSAWALVAALVVAACSGSSGGNHKVPVPTPGAPDHLTVAGLAAPLGLAPSDVTFAWHVRDARPGAVQRGYRVVVTRAPNVTVWDSGNVQSGRQSDVVYGGPPLTPDTAYRWTVQTLDTAGQRGPMAAAATFDTGLADGDWRASWIRRDATAAEGPDQHTYVRKQVTLGASPIVRARAYVSADLQYEMYVNGTGVGKGEAFSFPDQQYYETLDVTTLLHAGAPNALGILTYWDGPTKNHPGGAPGVIAQFSVLHRDGSRELITTDGTWRVHKAAWLASTQRDLEGDIVHYTEHVDGRAIPTGWDRIGFDDHTWVPATVIGPAGTAPWTHLVPVRTRLVEEPVQAQTVRRLPNGSLVADFGKVYAAMPQVTFHHGKSGRVIAMHAGYLLDPDGQVSIAHGTQHTDMSYSYIERGGGDEQFAAFDYLGFRYLQIDDPAETLAAGDIVAVTRHDAVPDEHAATFTSSDPTVDAIFELGRHSALYSAQEEFVDTPTREQGGWLYDGFNESVTAMSAFGEQNVTRKSLLEYAQSQRRYWPNGAVNKLYPTSLGALDINEFTEIYPEWVWQYWMHTGDRSLLQTVYPVIVNVARYVATSIDAKTGLVKSLPSTSIYYDFPVVTRINVLGANVFRRVADVAAALGRPVAEIAQQRSRQSALTAAINARLTRADGTYVDGIRADGSPIPTAGQEANACALAYGVVPKPHVAAVATAVADFGMQAVPRTASEVLLGLAAAGRDTDLLRILTDAHGNGWANILARGATFTWEVWQPSDIIGDSMSHGWGANVLVAIQQDLLGVTPTSPGFATFAVSPPAHALARAAGTVPTPAGPITVSWQRGTSSGRAFIDFDLSVPPNTSATALLPGEAPITFGAGHHHVRA